jgi:hypothetical protein
VGQVGEQLVDALDGDVDVDHRLDVERERGVGAMHDRLEQHAAGPEPGPAVAAPAPADELRVGGGERRQHRADTAGQPRWGGAGLGEAEIERPGREARPGGRRHVGGRPPVERADVLDDVGHGPARTGRDRRGLVAHGDQLDQAGGVRLQGGHVLEPVHRRRT